MAAHDRDDLPTLIAHLKRQVDEFDYGGGRMTDHQRLTCEALNCAQHGDLDEARYRLRIRDRPKFWSMADCLERYRAAMAETRRAREAGV